MPRAVVPLGASLVPSSRVPVDSRRWTVAQREAETCTRCELHTSRSRVVFGDGDPAAELVFVGDSPRHSEELSGRALAGAAGNLLDNVLLENGLRREDVYVCNLVKCRPPDNRPPQADEIGACRRHLHDQLGLVAARVIVTLGPAAAQLLLGRRAPLEKVAGYRFEASGATLIATYHPIAALRGNATAMAALRRDVRTAAGILTGRIASARDAVGELREGQGSAAS